MQRKFDIIKRLDWVSILIYLILLVIGWFTIYAAEYNESHKSLFDLSQNYGKQFLWIIISLVIGASILIIDGRFFSSFANIIYLLTILVLIAVLFIGKEISGSKAWFEIGSFKLQPSEFAKFATNLALAKLLSSHKIPLKTFRQRITAFFIIGIPIIFIILQGDAGSAIVYVAFILVLFREGLSPWILILGVIIAVFFILALLIDIQVLIGIITVICFLLIWTFRNKRKNIFATILVSLITISFVFLVDYGFYEVLKPHQRQRINVLLNKEVDTKGAAYNITQSKIAIGSGRFFGKGFLKGTQTKYNFVPEQSTDFIFCTIGEEHGFIGSFIVIGLFLLLLLRIINQSEKQRSPFSRAYGYGVAVILFFHFAINTGMTIGLAPVIGIPFPFFSYGGSNLLSFTILLFIFIKLDAENLLKFH